jgi:hypothetical protein
LAGLGSALQGQEWPRREGQVLVWQSRQGLDRRIRGTVSGARRGLAVEARKGEHRQGRVRPGLAVMARCVPVKASRGLVSLGSLGAVGAAVPGERGVADLGSLG